MAEIAIIWASFCVEGNISLSDLRWAGNSLISVLFFILEDFESSNWSERPENLYTTGVLKIKPPP